MLKLFRKLLSARPIVCIDVYDVMSHYNVTEDQAAELLNRFEDSIREGGLLNIDRFVDEYLEGDK
jgi:hypothetical protein